MRFVSLILVLCLLTGCIVPIPHTTRRSPALKGKVFDERTHEPIPKARIGFTGHPSLSCKTDSTGSYHMQETENWHLLLLVGAGNSSHWPDGVSLGDSTITVSHPDYVTRELHLYDNQNPILLKRLGEPSESRPWLIFNDKGVILQDMGAAQYLKPGGIQNEHCEFATGRLDTLHIEFVQPVHAPEIMQLQAPEAPPVKGNKEKVEKNWGFDIFYLRADIKKASSSTYRLEFTP